MNRLFFLLHWDFFLNIQWNNQRTNWGDHVEELFILRSFPIEFQRWTINRIVSIVIDPSKKKKKKKLIRGNRFEYFSKESFIKMINGYSSRKKGCRLRFVSFLFIQCFFLLSIKTNGMRMESFEDDILLHQQWKTRRRGDFSSGYIDGKSIWTWSIENPNWKETNVMNRIKERKMKIHLEEINEEFLSTIRWKRTLINTFFEIIDDLWSNESLLYFLFFSKKNLLNVEYVCLSLSLSGLINENENEINLQICSRLFCVESILFKLIPSLHPLLFFEHFHEEYHKKSSSHCSIKFLLCLSWMYNPLV